MMFDAVVYGTSTYSLYEISAALKKLRVSHTIVSGHKRMEVSLNRPQPKRVLLLENPAKVDPNAVNFIVASAAELSLTTCSRLRGLPIVDAVKDALLRDEVIHFDVSIWTAMDYVTTIAKPSKLNFIQTELLRIQPYSLRKEASGMMLKFFRGTASAKTVSQTMRKSSKLTKLWVLIQDYSELRDAVARLSSETPEQVSISTGIPTFELLYISRAKS
jgi:hypothetical protein